jgi:hypothetical protein
MTIFEKNGLDHIRRRPSASIVVVSGVMIGECDSSRRRKSLVNMRPPELCEPHQQPDQMSGHTLESFRRKWDSQEVQALAGTGELVAQEEPQPTGVPVQQTRNTARERQFQHRVSELQSSVVTRSSRGSTPVMENREFCEQSERPWVVP